MKINVDLSQLSEEEFISFLLNDVNGYLLSELSPALRKKQDAKKWTAALDIVRANINQLKNKIDYLYKHFKVVSFDNLALEQLDVRNTVDKDTWETSYMGEDGSATFFIDAVANTYARSSISKRIPIDIQDVNILFRKVQTIH